MANVLRRADQELVIRCLVDGASVRATERISSVHRDTILRLMVCIGDGCQRLMDREMRNLRCQRIEVDEVWGYVKKKQRHVRTSEDTSQVGDMWTFVAIDPDSKVIPTYRLGKRNLETATAFLTDLAGRLTNRIQLSSDALAAYVDASERAFGAGVDYGQIVKSYEAEPIGPGRYSPPKVVSTKRTPISGDPEVTKISTSHVERSNLTLRMSQRRFTRLTNAFSKKLENLKAAVGLHFGHYNFVRGHLSLDGITPAMAAGVTTAVWDISELIDMAKHA